MSHDHHHHDHHHAPVLTRVNMALVVGIVFNLVFVIVEVACGLYTGSLALLTDAGHNLGDVASLALALIAFRLSRVKASANFTYGYQKTTILVALVNAVILLLAIGGIGWEATHRLLEPGIQTPGKTVAIVAAIGILVNGSTAFLFFKSGSSDLNVKGAYLHLVADALVSLGVVVAGVIMVYTNWWWMDIAVSFIIMAVIFVSTWKLLKHTLRLSLDGVPQEIELEKIRAAMSKVEGVKGVHHIHVWAISTTRNALTAHITLDGLTSMQNAEKIKHELRHRLEHLGIQHATLETEADVCGDGNCG
jgi:cobalt-zinc-cadmium efflux system protein